jgi:DNA-directed RNA polymerase subunit beta'
MNRLRVTANSRDAAIRAQWKRAQEHLIMANTAAEEHAAELEQGAEAAVFSDPLAGVEGETHGTDADAGEYLQASDETLEAPEAIEEEAAPEAAEEEAAPEKE